jgi:hypothetical protein
MDMEAPVFLLFIIDKCDADNLSDEQINKLKKVAKAIKDERKKES